MSEEKLESQEQCLETENVEIREEEKTLIKQESMYENFKNLTSDQDFSQKNECSKYFSIRIISCINGFTINIICSTKVWR